MNNSEIREKLRKITRLPSSANIFPEIFQLMNDPKANMAQFEAVIRKDPALSAQVLRMINSPYYGLPREITRLKQALALLGMEEIYRIVSSVSYYSTFKKVFNNLSFSLNLLWTHFEWTSTIAQILAERYFPRFTGEAYILGLLHDTGKLVLDQFFPEEWAQVLETYQKIGGRMEELEKEAFGYDHAEIAAMLFEEWRLPSVITDPIKYHHRPFECESQPELCQLLFAADQIASALIYDDKIRMATQEGKKPEADWEKIITRYPNLNILADEEKSAELQDEVYSRLRKRQQIH